MPASEEKTLEPIALHISNFEDAPITYILRRMLPLYQLTDVYRVTNVVLREDDVWQFELSALFFSRYRRPTHVPLPHFKWQLAGLPGPAVLLEKLDWQIIDTRQYLDDEELVGSDETTRARYSRYVAAVASYHTRYIKEHYTNQQYDGRNLPEPTDYFTIRIQEQLYDLDACQVRERCRLVLEEDVEFDDEEGLKRRPFEKIQEQAMVTTTFLLAIHSQQTAASDYDRLQLIETDYDWRQFIDIRPRHWSTHSVVDSSFGSSSSLSSLQITCRPDLVSTGGNTPLRLNDSDPETSGDEAIPNQQNRKINIVPQRFLLFSCNKLTGSLLLHLS